MVLHYCYTRLDADRLRRGPPSCHDKDAPPWLAGPHRAFAVAARRGSPVAFSRCGGARRGGDVIGGDAGRVRGPEQVCGLSGPSTSVAPSALELWSGIAKTPVQDALRRGERALRGTNRDGRRRVRRGRRGGRGRARRRSRSSSFGFEGLSSRRPPARRQEEQKEKRSPRKSTRFRR